MSCKPSTAERGCTTTRDWGRRNVSRESAKTIGRGAQESLGGAVQRQSQEGGSKSAQQGGQVGAGTMPERSSMRVHSLKRKKELDSPRCGHQKWISMKQLALWAIGQMNAAFLEVPSMWLDPLPYNKGWAQFFLVVIAWAQSLCPLSPAVFSSLAGDLNFWWNCPKVQKLLWQQELLITIYEPLCLTHLSWKCVCISYGILANTVLPQRATGGLGKPQRLQITSTLRDAALSHETHSGQSWDPRAPQPSCVTTHLCS